jgi:hypothetical protein
MFEEKREAVMAIEAAVLPLMPKQRAHGWSLNAPVRTASHQGDQAHEVVHVTIFEHYFDW